MVHLRIFPPSAETEFRMWLAALGPLVHAAGTLTWDGIWQPTLRKPNARPSTRTGGPKNDDDDEEELVRKLLPIVTIIIILIVIFDQ